MEGETHRSLELVFKRFHLLEVEMHLVHYDKG